MLLSPPASSCRAHALPLVLALFCASACSSDGGAQDGDDAPSGGRNGVITVGGGGKPGTSPSAGATSSGVCGELDFEGCAGLSYEGESVPLDIYVMFDQSGSMLNEVAPGVTRLQAVQRATAEFLRDPASARIGVGIGYFGKQPIGQASCVSDDYAAPDVAVTLDHEQVIQSLNVRAPTGETPTASALQGACSYASDWKRRNPGRTVVILLVTDGVPEAPISCKTGSCCPTLDEATQVARACSSGDQGVSTYVLGVGPALQNLSSIAAAGRTKQAYLVEDSSATTDVLRALNAIRGDALVPCDLEIPPAPPGATLDHGQVNLSYATSQCNYQPLYYVDTATHCGPTGGWYYDDPALPSRVKLCPSSCDIVSQPNVSMRFSVGCRTLPPPVR